MNDKEILELFKSTGALVTGHFQLTSGLHSSQYVQCALVLQDPANAGKLGGLLAARFKDKEVALVLGMDIGSIIVAREVARALGARSAFAERESGSLTLPTGDEIRSGEKVLIVEDLVTAGESTKGLIDAVTRIGGDVIGVGSLVNQSREAVEVGVPVSLLTLTLPTFAPADCPLCREGTPAVEPTSI